MYQPGDYSSDMPWLFETSKSQLLARRRCTTLHLALRTTQKAASVLRNGRQLRGIARASVDKSAACMCVPAPHTNQSME